MDKKYRNVTLNLKEADYQFIKQLANQRVGDSVVGSGKPISIEQYVSEMVEAMLVDERRRQLCDPEYCQIVVCPQCGCKQWINKKALVDGWRCRRCMAMLTWQKGALHAEKSKGGSMGAYSRRRA